MTKDPNDVTIFWNNERIPDRMTVSRSRRKQRGDELWLLRAMVNISRGRTVSLNKNSPHSAGHRNTLRGAK